MSFLHRRGRVFAKQVHNRIDRTYLLAEFFKLDRPSFGPSLDPAALIEGESWVDQGKLSVNSFDINVVKMC